MPLIKAQRILGHSDPKLTAAIYSHREAEDLRESIERIEATNAVKPARVERT